MQIIGWVYGLQSQKGERREGREMMCISTQAGPPSAYGEDEAAFIT
jgi:hypothetical protein